MLKDKIIVDANKMSTIQDLFKIGMARDIAPVLNTYGGVQVNLGSGSGMKELLNTISLDFPEWNAEYDPLPYEDNSVDVYHAYHFLEHIKHVAFVLQEVDRTLKPGGYINIVVPYYNSNLQFSNLDHVSYFNEKTFDRVFNETTYHNGSYKFRLQVHMSVIIGIVERNMALMTQLVKI